MSDISSKNHSSNDKKRRLSGYSESSSSSYDDSINAVEDTKDMERILEEETLRRNPQISPNTERELNKFYINKERQYLINKENGIIKLRHDWSLRHQSIIMPVSDLKRLIIYAIGRQSESLDIIEIVYDDIYDIDCCGMIYNTNKTEEKKIKEIYIIPKNRKNELDKECFKEVYRSEYYYITSTMGITLDDTLVFQYSQK